MLDDDKSGWHLNKNISIGHLITTFTVAASVMFWAMSMDTRVTVLERELAHSQAADERMEKELKESLIEVKATLLRIEMRMDAKADKK